MSSLSDSCTDLCSYVQWYTALIVDLLSSLVKLIIVNSHYLFTQVDDFDFWLSGSDSVSTPAKSVSPVTPSREKIPEIEIAHAPIDDSDEDSKHDEVS